MHTLSTTSLQVGAASGAVHCCKAFSADDRMYGFVRGAVAAMVENSPHVMEDLRTTFSSSVYVRNTGFGAFFFIFCTTPLASWTAAIFERKRFSVVLFEPGNGAPHITTIPQIKKNTTETFDMFLNTVTQQRHARLVRNLPPKKLGQ
jgi:hypothetical protein